jgi:hypothetical protein
MAAASANERPAANALVSARRSFYAESLDLRRERYARTALCRRRALGPPPVSPSGLTPHLLDGLNGNRGKTSGAGAFFSCADSSAWTLYIMCRRHPPFPR